MKEERNRVYIRSCKMVLWPIRARVLFELFYNDYKCIIIKTCPQAMSYAFTPIANFCSLKCHRVSGKKRAQMKK